MVRIAMIRRIVEEEIPRLDAGWMPSGCEKHGLTVRPMFAQCTGMLSASAMTLPLRSQMAVERSWQTLISCERAVRISVFVISSPML